MQLDDEGMDQAIEINNNQIRNQLSSSSEEEKHNENDTSDEWMDVTPPDLVNNSQMQTIDDHDLFQQFLEFKDKERRRSHGRDDHRRCSEDMTEDGKIAMHRSQQYNEPKLQRPGCTKFQVRTIEMLFPTILSSMNMIYSCLFWWTKSMTS